MKKQLTAHEKKVELAKAAAPQYGIYIDGGNVEKLTEALESVGSVLDLILTSDSEEKTKRDAIALVRNSIPSVNHLTIQDVHIDIKK